MIGMTVSAAVAALGAVAQQLPKAQVAVGWTPASYILLAILITIVTGLTTGFTIWVKNKPAMLRASTMADASLRQDLLKRIGDMETRHSAEMADIRKIHNQELDEMRERLEERERRHELETASLRDQIKALQSILINLQIASGHAMPINIPPATQRMIDKIIEQVNHGDGAATIEQRLSLIFEQLEKQHGPD